MIDFDEGGMSCEKEDMGSICSHCSFKKQYSLPFLNGSGTKATKYGRDSTRTFKNDWAQMKVYGGRKLKSVRGK
jgi:hypothetical protein